MANPDSPRATSSAHRLVDGRWEPAGPEALTGPVAGSLWIDHDLVDPTEAERILAADWLRGVFPQLDTPRAASGGQLPPANPPRVRTFARWAFVRAFWLGSTADSGRQRLLAQEIHVLASDSLVITLRYPVLKWPTMTPYEVNAASRDGGLDIAKLRQHIVDVAEMCEDRVPHFGTLFLAGFLGRIASSYIQALDVVGIWANDLEDQVSGPDRSEVGFESLRLRRALRQLRWGFLPADESSELLVWPSPQGRESVLDARLVDVGAEADRALTTTRELMEQVQQTFDLEMALGQDAIERATYSLTVVAALVLPPTLIAGIYGMNFGVTPWSDGPVPLMLMAGSMLLGWLMLRRLDPRRGHKG